MAKNGWFDGWPKQATWARPIKDLLYEEEMEAKAVALKRSEEERKARETERELSRQESIERKSEMIRIAKALRGTMGAGVASLQRAGVVVVKVMETLSHDFASGAFDKMGPSAKFKLAKEFIEAEARLAEAFERLDKMARLDAGKPTEVIQVEDMTMEQAVQEIESASALLQLAREEGLLDGSSEPEPESEDPSGDGSNGRAVH